MLPLREEGWPLTCRRAARTRTEQEPRQLRELQVRKVGCISKDLHSVLGSMRESRRNYQSWGGLKD